MGLIGWELGQRVCLCLLTKCGEAGAMSGWDDTELVAMEFRAFLLYNVVMLMQASEELYSKDPTSANRIWGAVDSYCCILP
jgi:hypothetical protein